MRARGGGCPDPRDYWERSTLERGPPYGGGGEWTEREGKMEEGRKEE